MPKSAQCAIFAAAASIFFASAAPPALAQSKAADTPIVFRISKQLVEELTDDEIVVEAPVSDRFGDIPITGVATTRGRIHVAFESSDTAATFNVTARGKAYTTLTGTAGPVTVHG